MQFLKIGYHSVRISGRNISSRRVRDSVRSWCAFQFTTLSHMSTSAEPLPIIRIPHRIKRSVEDVEQLKGSTAERVKTVKPGKLLIKSKNSQLNQSTAHTLGKFEQPTLASKGWKHNKSFGDYFVLNKTRDVPPCVRETLQEEDETTTKKTTTFKHLNLCPDIVEILSRGGILYPTSVQLQTIPKLLRGCSVLCAAETGSGKTLTYLLPVVNKLKGETEADGFGQVAPHTSCVVLVPSRELAEQVKSVAKSLCDPLGMKVKVVGGGKGVGNIKLAFAGGPPDILVATPGALIKALRRRCLSMTELRFVVIDEADTMFDSSFADMVQTILTDVHVASDPSETQGPGRKAQLVVVGATFPGGVGDVLSQVTDLGNIVTVKSEMLHFLMPHVKQTFLKVKGEDKLVELHEALKTAEQGKAASLVFCNRASTVNWLGYMLDDLGVSHLRIQGEMHANVRAGIFRSFQKGLADVLICTDIASRGLDTQRAKLVINYDFPASKADYIHRAGRVGRAGGGVDGGGNGGDGAVLSFVTHPWDVELVQTIETAARRRAVLPGMETAIRKSTPKEDTDNDLES